VRHPVEDGFYVSVWRDSATALGFVKKYLQLPSESVAFAKELEPKEKKVAKERQGERSDKHPAKLAESNGGDSRDRVARHTTPGRTLPEKTPEALSSKGDTREIAANKQVGMSARTVPGALLVNQIFPPNPPQLPAKQQLSDRRAFQPRQCLQHSIRRESPRW